MARRLMPWSTFSQYVAFEGLGSQLRSRGVQGAATIGDLRRLARRAVPRFVFDYVDGAADREVTLARSRTAFTELQFNPRVLRDVASVDTRTELFGTIHGAPFGAAPTGFTRMLHSEGESAIARVARDFDIPIGLSTMANTSPEEVAVINPGGANWLQLYVLAERDRTERLLERAAAAGFDTLVVTVDVPISGQRVRDIRNGYRPPARACRQALFAGSVRTVLDAAPHVHWWWDFLTTSAMDFPLLGEPGEPVAELLSKAFDPSVTFEDLAWLRANWSGRLVIKGIQSIDDAKEAADRGADGIVLSSHGGRQLDLAPVPLRLVPEARRALGPQFPIIVDTGITNGSDIVAALATGADFTLVGRALVYGLMAGGHAGVEWAATILRTEIRRTMALLGVTRIADLTPELVTDLNPIPFSRRSSDARHLARK